MAADEQQAQDVVTIEITGIGALQNAVIVV